MCQTLFACTQTSCSLLFLVAQTGCLSVFIIKCLGGGMSLKVWIFQCKQCNRNTGFRFKILSSDQNMFREIDGWIFYKNYLCSTDKLPDKLQKKSRRLNQWLIWKFLSILICTEVELHLHCLLCERGFLNRMLCSKLRPV